MDGVVVFTGWGCLDYACAAAAVLRRHPGARVEAVSRHRLPRRIEWLAENEDIPERLYILGVPLTELSDPVRRAFSRLREGGCDLVWFSAIPGVGAQLTTLGFTTCETRGKALCEVVADGLDVDVADMKSLFRNKPPKKWEQASVLLDSASRRYRRIQTLEPYRRVVAYLRDGGGELDKELQQLIRSQNLYGRRELRGESRATQHLRERVQRVGRQSNCRVLIQGETGTGKETVAGLIHEYSDRRAESLICFNCADLSPHLLESRLFGHEKGAFTGALQAREGAFERADGGTLFLDEVAELGADAQAGLLRVLEEGRFYRLGGSEEHWVDVRVIAATNQSLPKLVSEGRFRDDLYHRLATVPIVIPPLRERPEDIPPIAADFWRHLTNRGRLTDAQLQALTRYPWPGNVRELRNLLERAQALGESDFEKLLAEHRRLSEGLCDNESIPPDNLHEMMRWQVQRILRRYDGNITRAAEALGVSRNTVKKYRAES